MEKSKSSTKTNNIILLLIFVVFLDTTGVAIVIIQLMSRLMKLGATPVVAGLISSLYGAVQLFSSPIVGGIGDKSDRKKVLIGSILLSSVSYFFLGFESLILFTISRFLSGLFKHTHSLSMACISELAKPEEKGKYFGFFGGGIGAGFVIGPVIGGLLAQQPNGFQIMSYATTLAFIINAIIIWKYIPEMKTKSHPKVSTKQKKKTISKVSGNSIMQYFNYLGIEGCWDIFLLQGILEIGMMINFTNFGLIIESDYGLHSKDLGLFIGGLSLVGVASSALSSKITQLLGEDRIIAYMFALAFVGFVSQTLRPTLQIYTLSTVLVCLSTTLLRNGWGNLVTSRSSPEKAGKVIGILHSISAVAGMIAPLLGGVVTELTDTIHSTTLLTTLFVTIGFIACFWFPRPLAKLKKH